VTGTPVTPWLRVVLENELAAQFQRAWIPRVGDLTVVAVCIFHIDRVELRVVERVERFETQLEVSPLGNGERLVERSCEVDTAGSDNRVLTRAAEALILAA
jgi:hypothetical protein